MGERVAARPGVEVEQPHLLPPPDAQPQTAGTGRDFQTPIENGCRVQGLPGSSTSPGLTYVKHAAKDSKPQPLQGFPQNPGNV